MKKITIMKNGMPSTRSSRNLGNFGYWERSINRLSIFCDDNLSPGYLVDGVINLRTRLTINRALKGFMKKYSGVSVSDQRPFAYAQEAEIRRVIEGGVLSI